MKQFVLVIILLAIMAGAALAQEKPPAQVNMEMALDALAEGRLQQYAGYVVGASEALEQAPGTLGSETPLSVMQHGADALIHMAESKRGNSTACMRILTSAQLLLERLTEQAPDVARWHYYYGVGYALLGDSANLDFGIAQFQAALRCSDAKTYASSASAMLAWCKAERKRQEEARVRQMRAINQYLQTHPASFASGSGWVTCIHCGHANWSGNRFCTNCKRPL